MQADRRAILHLVALGRISPAEAERFLAIWNEDRESRWALMGGFVVVCLALLLLHLPDLLPGLAHLVDSMREGNPISLHHALALFIHQ